MKKGVVKILILLSILFGGIIISLQYFIKKPNAMLSNEQILQTLSEKSGVDFRNSTIEKVEEVHISDFNSAIRIVLQIEQTEKTLIEEEIIQMRHEKLEVNDTFFPKIWKENVEGVTDYTCYEIYNGARRYAKSLNSTSCLFVLDKSQSSYTVYVNYAGD